MRVIAVIDQRVVVEKILRHLGLWKGGPDFIPARAPPDADAGFWTREPTIPKRSSLNFSV